MSAVTVSAALVWVPGGCGVKRGRSIDLMNRGFEPKGRVAFRSPWAQRPPMKCSLNLGAFTSSGWGRPHLTREPEAGSDAPEAAPEPSAKRVLVLSGGGIFGAAQAGMLQSLAEHSNWRPDVIVGTSAGALNGSWVAHDFTADATKALSDIWSHFDSRGVFPQGVLSQALNLVRRRPSVQDGAKLRSLISDLCPIERLEDLRIPLHVSATNILTGLPHWFDAGFARDVLYASAALPAIVPPAVIDGMSFVDGGVVANLPVQRAAELGGDSILCLDVSAAGNDSVPRTALGMLTRSFSIALNAATDAIVDAASIDRQLWRVRPTIDPSLNTSDWRACSRLVEAGAESMKVWLDHNAEQLEPVSEPNPAAASGPVIDLRRHEHPVFQRFARRAVS